MEIQPAVTESQFLEVYYPNSIIYIAFAVECKDISFEILKFNDNDSFNSVENYNAHYDGNCDDHYDGHCDGNYDWHCCGN